MTTTTIEELQADISELLIVVENIASDLSCAESCESKEDFRDNLATALNGIAQLQRDTKAMHKQASKCTC